MLEKHRLTYLDHLGIDNYMPRRVLPHALASQLLSDEALLEPTAFSTADVQDNGVSIPSQETTVDDTLTAQAVSAESPSLDALNVLLGKPVAMTPAIQTADSEQVTATISEPSVVEATPKASPSAVSSDEEVIRFSLSAWRIHDDLMVIDSRQPRMALPTDRLLQNILRSIGYPLAQLPPSDILRWPLIKDDRLSHPEAEARAMVQAFISAQCAKAPLKGLLLLGQDAVRFALDVEGDSQTFYHEHKGAAYPQAQWQTSALIAPSLIDMLQEPTLKRVTWQALQSWVQPE